MNRVIFIDMINPMKKIKKVASKKRGIGVLLEDMNSKLDLVVEQTSGLTEKVDNLETKVNNLTENMEIVKTSLEFVKNSLKQKVDAEEFAALERRVTLLESKLR